MPCNVMPWNHLTALLACTALAFAPSAALAQVTQAGVATGKRPAGVTGIRLGAPPASYIADRFMVVKLDDDKAATEEHEGRKITFVPALVGADLDEAAQGFILGVLETEAEGGETGLPAGRYTVFAKNVGGEWEAFAEASGSVAKQALSVSAEEAEAPGNRDSATKPRFSVSEGGWCWTTGPYPAPTSWGRYDARGYWHYYPAEWGRHQTLTVCW